MNYGYVYNLSASPVAECIWEGAKDSTSNNSVSLLINGLIDAGYAPRGYSGKIPKWNVFNPWSKDVFDAVFTADVKAALTQWQTSKGMKPDGIAGPDVWHALIGGSQVTRNCPKCAGNYLYGTEAPANCQSNVPTKADDTDAGGAWWPWAVAGTVVLGATVYGIYAFRKRSKRAN